MRLGKIGPLHHGHIGGIRADSFLGASNLNAEEDESRGGTGTQHGKSQYQGLDEQRNIVGSQQNWQGIDGQENFVGSQQNWQGLNEQQNIVGMEQNWQGIDGQENFVVSPQNWQGLDQHQNWQGLDEQQNIVGLQQNWQGLDEQQNIVGLQQNWQGLDDQTNQVGMEQNWQAFEGQGNFVGSQQKWQGMEQNWQGFDGQQNEQGSWILGLQPQMPENSRAFDDGLFGVKTDKLDKFDKIPPKPAPPPKFPKHPPVIPPKIPPIPIPPTPPTPPPYNPPTYNYHGNYGIHSHGHASNHPGANYGSYRRYGGGHSLHSHSNHHGHSKGFNKYGHSHSCLVCYTASCRSLIEFYYTTEYRASFAKMSALNSVRHLAILLIIGFVAYCSFSNGISLFAFHPPLMLTGFLLLMTEAVMVFSNDRLDFHGSLQFGAGVFISLGFLAIKYSAPEYDPNVEPSFHSNVGYTACLLSAGAFCGGILARFGGVLKLPVKIIRIFHALFGSLAYYLALNAICSGLNSEWLHSHVSQNVIYGLMGCVIVIGISAIYAPILGLYSRVKRLFAKAKQ